MYKLNLRASPLQALAATLAAAAAMLVVTAPQASANQPFGGSSPACHYDGVTYYACLDQFQYVGYLWYNGSSFLHVNLPEQYARRRGIAFRFTKRSHFAPFASGGQGRTGGGFFSKRC